MTFTALPAALAGDPGLVAHQLIEIGLRICASTSAAISGIFLQILLGGVPALTDADLAHGEPGTGLGDDTQPDAQVDQFAEWAMPSPYIMSNSASRKGGATLFFTTLARVRLPTTSPPFFSASIRRTSMRTEA